MLSTSKPKDLPDSYIKFLTNDLRKNFNLPGVPIRMNMRKKDNPYEKKK
jgi:GTP-binding protein